MIDLHIHFDGSISPAMILRLAKLQNEKLPSDNLEELDKIMRAPVNCSSLNEYLEKFELPLKLLQTEDTIKMAMRGLIGTLSRQGIIYAEIRFAPQLHCERGLSMETVVEAAIDGMYKTSEDNNNIKINLILCCMRGNDNSTANFDTVRIAKKYLGNGVCACDLAGAEALFKTKDYAEVFELANELEVPFTIHAGEADGADSIKTAIEFGAKRIGHGIKAISSEEVISLIKEKNITLECCPTSNVQTKAVESIKKHPVGEFLKRGVKATVNTDNMTVSGTTINDEFEMLKNAGIINSDDVKTLLLNSANAAFAADKEKERLRYVITKAF